MLIKQLMFLPSDFCVCLFLQVSNIHDVGRSRRRIAMAVGPYQLRHVFFQWQGVVSCEEKLRFFLVPFFGELRICSCWPGHLWVDTWGGRDLSKCWWINVHAEVQRILERIGELNRAELLQKAEALGFTRKQAQALWETFEAWMIDVCFNGGWEEDVSLDGWLVLLGSMFVLYDWLPRFLFFLLWYLYIYRL